MSAPLAPYPVSALVYKTQTSGGTVAVRTSESESLQLAPSAGTSGASILAARGFKDILGQLTGLEQEEDPEDRPTEFAATRARQLLREAHDRLPLEFPRAVVATGPNRSVRFLWREGTRQVRLVIGGGPGNKTYIYWEDGPGKKHGTEEKGITAETLIQFLLWNAQLPGT